jgi:hypothetical protein
MASFTPCSPLNHLIFHLLPVKPSTKRHQATPRLLVAGTFVLTMYLHPLNAFAQLVSLESAEVRRTENSLVLATTLALDLSGSVENALSKGIAVSFVTQVRLEKGRWYWYDKVLYQSERQVRLSYLPLTRKWRIQFSETPSLGETGLSQQFDSLSSALAVMRKPPEIKLTDTSELDNGAKYEAIYVFKLDTTQLPKPFQLGAALGPEWHLGTSKSIQFTFDTKSDVYR